MFQTALAIQPSGFAKAHGKGPSGPKPPKPKLGYADGMAVLAIGPKGGKIVGWKNGKPIYAGGSAAKALAKLKAAAKAVKGAPAKHPTESEHAGQVGKWLDEIGIPSKGHGFAGVFVVSTDGAKKLTDSFPELKTVAVGGLVKVQTAGLWPHVGEPLKPHEDELVAWAAKGAAGTDDDPPFTDKTLSTLKLKGPLGGSHGGKIVVDENGAQYAWKTNNGQKWVSRAEEVFNRVALLVFPKAELYPDAEMVEHEGQQGVLLEWIHNKGTIGNEEAGDHGVATSVLQKHFETLVQHQVLDWMMSNHDSHGANFVHTMNGNVAAIDKGQAFKAIGADKLSDSYTLNPSSPAYNAMWKLFQKGEITGDPVKAAAEVLDSIEKNLSLEQYHALVLPYLEEASSGLDGFDPKKKWALIEQRFKDLRSNWETFLSEMTGKKVSFADVAAETAPPPASAAVEDKDGEPTDVAQVPGWPIKKGKVTVHHPGGAQPSGWPSKYPGPGYLATVSVSGKFFGFKFKEKDGKPSITVSFPDGQLMSYPSPASAADSVQLFNKGLPLDMSSSDKKKNGIAHSAPKLFALKAFEEDFKAAGTAGAISPGSMTVDELMEDLGLAPAKKTLTLHEMLSAVEDGIVDDPALMPSVVQSFAKKSAEGVPWMWPKNAPAPGSVIKILAPDGGFEIYVPFATPDGSNGFKNYVVSTTGSTTEHGVLPFHQTNKIIQTALKLPGVVAAAKEANKAMLPKPEKPKPEVGPAPKAELIPGVVQIPSVFAEVYPKKGGPLPVGHKHVVSKPFPEHDTDVMLEVLEDGFEVTIDVDDPVTFTSLSAASDYVWLKQKGYADKDDYKKKTGNTKIASGGGWKFFGVQPKSGELMSFAIPLTPSAPGEPGWDDWKLPSADELGALPESTKLAYGEPGSKSLPGGFATGEDGWVKVASGWKPLGEEDIPALSDQQLSFDIAEDANAGYGGVKAVEPGAPALHPLTTPAPKVKLLFTQADLDGMPEGAKIIQTKDALSGDAAEMMQVVWTKTEDGKWSSITIDASGFEQVLTGALPASDLSFKPKPGWSIEQSFPSTQPTPAQKPALVWEGLKIPTAEEVASLPAGTLLSDTAGFFYKKTTEGDFVDAEGVNFNVEEITDGEMAITHQPGAPGTSGTKPLTVAELNAMPTDSIVTTGKYTYTKNENGTWSPPASTGLWYPAEMLMPEQHEWAVTLPDYTPTKTVGSLTPSLPPPVTPSGIATPSISGTPGPKVVTTKETLPTFAEKDLIWSNAQKLAGAPVPGKEGKTFGMKSPHWENWIPPMGVWIEGTWAGKKTWFTTTASGYNDDGSAPHQSKFFVVDEDGKTATAPAEVVGIKALALTLANLTGGLALVKAVVDSFNLAEAAFVEDDTFATHEAMPTAGAAIGVHPQDIPPEQKTKTVVTTMALGDYIKQESVSQKYGGTFYLSQSDSAEEKYGVGAHYLRFYPDGGVGKDAGTKLQAFINDHDLTTWKKATHYAGDTNSWAVITGVGASSEHAVETTVIEAASTPPTVQTEHDTGWPGGATLTSEVLAEAPKGAAVWTSDPDAKYIKLGNENWSSVDAEGAPDMEVGLWSSQIAAMTLIADSGYAGVPPNLGAYESVHPAQLKMFPLGAVLHSDKGMKLTKKNETYWVGSDGNLYGNTTIATNHNVVHDTMVMGPTPEAAKPKVKTIGGHLNQSTIGIKIFQLPPGTKLSTKEGDVFTVLEGQEVKFGAVDKFGKVGDGSYSSSQVAGWIKEAGGASVQYVGDKVKAKKTPAALVPAVKKPAVNDEQVKKAKEWQAWAKEHPKPSGAEELLVLAHLQDVLKTNGYTEGLYAHVDTKGNYLIGATNSADLKKAVDNWDSMPPYKEETSPLGAMVVVKKAFLLKKFPAAKYVKGKDGELHPKGTTFETTTITTKTVQDVVLEESSQSEQGKPKKIKPHADDSDKVVIKFNGIDDAAQKAAKAFLDKHNIEAHGDPMVNVSTVYSVTKADLDAAVETATTYTPKLPTLPEAFVQAPVPFALGPQKQGELATNNEGDLGALDSFKLGHWGHSIRHGGAGLWKNSQVSVRRVANPDGEDFYELTGDLLDFKPSESKLTKGTIKYTSPSGEYGAPNFDVYSEETGLHDKGTHTIEGGWAGYDGKTDAGSYVGICHEGSAGEGGTYSGRLAMRNRLTLRVPVSGDVQTELQHALQMAGVSPELAASSHDEDAERLFIKSSLVRSGLGGLGQWMYDVTGNSLDLGNYGHEPWLDNQLKKMGYDKYVDTAEIRVGAGGAHTVWFDRFDDDKLKDVYFVHTGGASPTAAASFLLGGTGVPSRKQGYTNGTAPSGGSTTQDMHSGGAAGVFSRVARKDGPGATSVHGYNDGDTEVRYIYHPRVLKRADYWAHHTDRYGSLKDGSTKMSGKPDEAVLKLTGSDHEVLFENGVAVEDIAGIWCKTAAIRNELIGKMKGGGKSDINGVALNDFFFTGSQSDAALKTACKGLQVMT